MRIKLPSSSIVISSPSPAKGSNSFYYLDDVWVPAFHMMTAEFSPLGIPLEVEADEPRLRAAVADACRGWEGVADQLARRIHLKLGLGAVASSAGDPIISVEGLRLRLCGGGVEAWADATRGRAECVVTDDILRDRDAFRETVLDPLLLFLLTRSGRTPIHASGFIAGDIAILLAGPSGSGKSCLALAAHQAGFQLLSDDTVYVQLQPELRVWGVPRPIHVFPEDAPAGPENELRLRNGKLKQAVPVDAGNAAGTATKMIVCVLTPGATIDLRPIEQAEAIRGQEALEPGFDLLRSDVMAAMESLTRNGAWRLTLSSDPAAAIRCLSENLPVLAAAGRR